MKKLSDLKVGDTVWVGDVNARGREPRPATVQKVGRKLVTIDGDVFRLDTGYANDGYSHRWIIPDLAAYRERNERDRVWLEIRQHHRLDDSVDLQAVLAAAKLLGVLA